MPSYTAQQQRQLTALAVTWSQTLVQIYT